MRRPGLIASAVLLVAGLTPMQSVQALGGGSGSVSLTLVGSAYTQDFDTLANTGTTNNLTINGWYLDEAGSSGANNGQYAAGTGSDNAGDVYSFGAAANTERAFGTLLSGTLDPTIGAQFTNNTGSTAVSLDVLYVGEMWRAGVTNRNAADRLDFQLSTNATSLTTGTWVDYNSLDFNSPNTNTSSGALDGNSASNQTAVSFSITGLSIPDGASFWIRWTDFDISSSDDGLAVDDFELTPLTGGAPAPNPTLTVARVGSGSGTITSVPPGISCPPDCSEAVAPARLTEASEQVYVLTAHPASGSVFTRWSGGCQGTSPTCTLVLSSDTFVAAWFDAAASPSPSPTPSPSPSPSPSPPPAPVTFELHASKVGKGRIVSDLEGINCGTACSATYDEGTSITLTATPKAGWMLKRWRYGCSGSELTCTFEMDSNRRAKAVFVKIPVVA